MPYKTVNLPIRVPEGKYCWEFNGEHNICHYLSNEGGYPECALGLGNVDFTEGEGVLKPEKCKSLLESEKCPTCNGTGIDVTLGQVGTCNTCGGKK